jgi:hypothetical protein
VSTRPAELIGDLLVEATLGGTDLTIETRTEKNQEFDFEIDLKAGDLGLGFESRAQFWMPAKSACDERIDHDNLDVSRHRRLALESFDLMMPGLHCFHHQRGDAIRDDTVATGENIDGGVAMLRPSVNGNMAFRDNYNSTNTLRTEVVEARRNDGGTATDGAIPEDRFKTVRRIQNRPRAIT